MTTTFRLTADDLDQGFLDRVKEMFRERRIAVTVSDEEDQSIRSTLPSGTPMSELLKLRGIISNDDAEEMKRAMNGRRHITPEEAASYRQRVRSLRGILKGIDTTVERDEDRV